MIVRIGRCRINIMSKYVRKIEPFNKDERGWQAFLNDEDLKVRDVVLLESKKGAVRANHYHKKNMHYLYIVSGKVECTSKDMSDPKAEKETVVLGPGEMYISPAMVAHKVVAMEDSLMIAISNEPRDQESYELDTVRLEL